MEERLLISNIQNYPPGIRFHPSDEELITFYLFRKVKSLPLPANIITDIELYSYNPWDLPRKALFGEDERYFFTPRDRKYPNGGRPNRATASGYWKATGTDKPILSSSGSRRIGVKKALVFYKGKPPTGHKMDWIMTEYRLPDTSRPLRSKGSMRGGVGSFNTMVQERPIPRNWLRNFAGKADVSLRVEEEVSMAPLIDQMTKHNKIKLSRLSVNKVIVHGAPFKLFREQNPMYSINFKIIEKTRNSKIWISLQLDDWVLCRIRQKGNMSKNDQDDDNNLCEFPQHLPNIKDFPALRTDQDSRDMLTDYLLSSEYHQIASLLTGHDMTIPKTICEDDSHKTNTQEIFSLFQSISGSLPALPNKEVNRYTNVQLPTNMKMNEWFYSSNAYINSQELDMPQLSEKFLQ